jgi:UPF0271 protein
VTRAVDFSSEMGESFVLPLFGVGRKVIESLVIPGTGERFHYRHGLERFDDAVMPFLTSVHLACGLHSGDPVVLQRSIPAFTKQGIAIGAHPSYPDIFRFGQNRVDLAPDELEAVILFQFGALDGVLRAHGRRIQHVKCHGALMFDVAYDPAVCDAMIGAIQKFDPALILVLMAGTPSVTYARGKGIRVAEEGFVDRGYDQTGNLVSRQHPKALILDPAEAADRLVQMVIEGETISVEGKKIALRAQTFCIHSDTPGAGAIMACVSAAMKSSGISMKPMSEVVAAL